MFKKQPDPFYFPCQEVPLQKKDKLRYLDMTTKRQLNIASGRMNFMACCFMVFYAIIIGRLFYLTVMNYEARSFKVGGTQTNYALSRRNIMDRNGIILATSLPTVDLSVDPSLVKDDPQEVAQKIHSALPDIDTETIYNKITSNAGFKYIKRNLTPKERSAVNCLGYYFLSETKGEKRVYPQGSLVAHLLGGVDIDNIGIAGIEKAYDTELMDKDVQLSIDVSVQEMTREALSKGVEKFQAEGGLALVMDIKTGEILASVSLPDYDPNVPAGKAGKERFNQATLGTYEFGSVFKLFNTALGLESKTITVNDIFDTSKPWKIGKKSITDYRGQNRPLMVPEILIHSSNIGSAQIGLKIGWQKQKEFLGQFGFYDKLPIPLPERGTTQYLKKEPWAEMESATISYGYGISVTPLHLIAGVAALANGGLYHTPTFIKGGNEGKAETRVISEATSEKMRHMMWAVVNYELSDKSPIKTYAVGGKTGSANLIINGKYVEKRLRTTFVGAFPMNDPKYIVMVSMTDPKGIKETFGFNAAGWNAKAVGVNIIGEIAPYLGVAPVEDWKQPAYIEKAFERSLAHKKRK
ncbi:MAG: penicillin-binding protein 2 [Alphaproteobacteria bacterium]|nr:penicillin-binding protein 2 [Alphaproteobacteria bacterium]